MNFSRAKVFFINSNILAAMEASGDAPHVINESFLFHPVFLSGHFKSIFETKYVIPVIHDRRFDIIEFRGRTSAQKNIQEEENSEFLTRNVFSEIWLLLSLRRSMRWRKSGLP